MHYVQRLSKVSELPEDDGKTGRTVKTEKNDNAPAQRDSKVSECGEVREFESSIVRKFESVKTLEF